jgi:hypothetical protein
MLMSVMQPYLEQTHYHPRAHTDVRNYLCSNSKFTLTYLTLPDITSNVLYLTTLCYHVHFTLHIYILYIKFTVNLERFIFPDRFMT